MSYLYSRPTKYIPKMEDYNRPLLYVPIQVYSSKNVYTHSSTNSLKNAVDAPEPYSSTLDVKVNKYFII